MIVPGNKANSIDKESESTIKPAITPVPGINKDMITKAYQAEV